MPIETGMTLGAYEVHELIGQGPLGTVFRAYHAGLARPAAVKVLHALAPDQNTRARFRREAQAIGQVRHPNLLKVYDSGDFEGTPYMVVEYMAGGALGDRMKAEERFDRSTALRLLEGIAAALDHVHGFEIVHCAVNPAKVLLDGVGNPVLADTGLANLLQGTPLNTGGGGTAGTSAYLAPEQVMGSSIGPAADIYALATMAYELLAGAVPFEGEGMLELLYAHVHRVPPTASSRNPDLSAAVDSVLARGLAKDPDARWPTGGAIVAALRVALAADPAPALVTATPAPPRVVAAIPRAVVAAPATPAPTVRRSWIRVAVGAGIGVLLLAAGDIVLAQALWAHPTAAVSAAKRGP